VNYPALVFWVPIVWSVTAPQRHRIGNVARINPICQFSIASGNDQVRNVDFATVHVCGGFYTQGGCTAGIATGDSSGPDFGIRMGVVFGAITGLAAFDPRRSYVNPGVENGPIPSSAGGGRAIEARTGWSKSSPTPLLIGAETMRPISPHRGPHSETGPQRLR
jgi:hypothetical protein